MRWLTFSLLFVVACEYQPPRRPAGRLDTLEFTVGVPPDSADSVLHTPRLVTRPAMVVFWLAAGDTLHPDDQAAAFDELTAATEAVVPALAAQDVQLLPTNADTVFIELPNHKRRAVLLTGLEYPFGYVLVDPASTERILAGVYSEDELLEELRAYFDLPDDTIPPPRKVAA